MPNELNANVRRWLAACTGVISWDEVRPCLSEDVIQELAGRKTYGRDAVINQMKARPSAALVKTIWTVLPGAAPQRITMRGAIPGGVISSPGGPMSALDFEFALGSDGLITRISPRPHHIEPPNLRAPLKIGETAPAFTLADIFGQAVSLPHKDCSATLIVFISNHCPWALGWHDRLQRLARDYAARHVRVLQINSNDPAVSPFDSIEHSRKRAANGDYAAPPLADPGQTVARQFGARHTPEAFLLDAQRRVTYHGAPDADSEKDSLDAVWIREALDAVLSGTEVRRPVSAPMGCTIKWTL